MELTTIRQLEQRLKHPLPGDKSQFMMAPGQDPRYRDVRADHRVACVMLLLHPEDNQWNISYIKRTSDNPHDKHAGQISFPGGKLEDGDSSLEECALRETEEEIGVIRSKVNIIGKMSELYVFASNFVVHPYVGFTEKAPDFVLQASEVDRVISPSLHYISDKSIIKRDNIQVRNFTLSDVPYFDLFGEILWGATAMITSEFLDVYREARPSQEVIYK